MPTIKEFGNEYSIRLFEAKKPEKEFEIILSDINRLIVTSSKEPITNEEKAKIVEIIIENLETYYRGPTRIFEQTEIIKAFSNDNYLELIDYIKTRIKK